MISEYTLLERNREQCGPVIEIASMSPESVDVAVGGDGDGTVRAIRSKMSRGASNKASRGRFKQGHFSWFSSFGFPLS